MGRTIREAIANKNGEDEPFIVKCRRRPPPVELEREIPAGLVWDGLETIR